MINLFDSHQDCCGCTACKHICPIKAIEMESDEEGFLYPSININLCTECGMCISVCPNKSKVNIDKKFEIPKVYAAKHVSDAVRLKSSSGGIYTALSDYVINERKGICYGAVFDREFNVCHDTASTIEERERLRGSKYIQSDLRNVFIKIKEDLIDDKTVLFTGTPCQTAGLSKYLERSKVPTSKLVLNDIICHGTPSPKLWKDYINYIKEINKSELEEYTFRSKEKGWRGYNVKAKFSNGYIRLNSDDILKYIKLYKSNLILRPSCYCCKHTSLDRPSDIMIGDFWGIEKSIPEFEDAKGVSLVLLNTELGEKLFNKIKCDLEYKESNTKDCLQLNLYQPTPQPPNRKKFWKDYKKRGFSYIAKKYTRKTLIRQFVMKLKKYLRSIFY